MFSRISKLFAVCIILTVISGVQQVSADEMEAGTWTQKADMPTARGLAGSAVVDGKIYVIGGAPVAFGTSTVVEEYDPATDTWTKRADMPTTRQGVRAAAVDGIIYAIGGWTPNRVVSTVEAYDPATDTWTKKADMPTARSCSAIAVVDGRIYVISGYNDNDIELPAVEAYEPSTDRWTKKADIPTPREAHAACVVDGRIYVFGGTTKYSEQRRWGCVPTVEVYDPATDIWTQASDMPVATRYGYSASAVDEKIYIIGGQEEEAGTLYDEGQLDVNDLEELFSIVYVYDPTTDTWATAAPHPFVTTDLAAGVVDGKIYTIGGNWGATKYSTVYEYDPSLPGVIPSVSPGGKLLETWGQVKKIQ